MLAYSIDFRSEYTVTHTVTTVGISVEIARLLNYSAEDKQRIYYGALLHDVGKIAIPLEILEYPGKLSPQAMRIMRTHVELTGRILGQDVEEKIRKIALRTMKSWMAQVIQKESRGGTDHGRADCGRGGYCQCPGRNPEL